jgi:membrane protein DedA with SNARE-associated domain
MHQILSLLAEHGYILIFCVVLAEQVGLPIPAVPVLLGVGALAGTGGLPLIPAVVLGWIAALISDSLWYWLGRRRGASILRLLCRISLEPDSCVSNAKRSFAKLGGVSLVIAKFVPGLSTAAPPMAGVNGMPFWRFLLFDGAGSLLWVGAFLALGFAFHSQLETIAESVAAYGSGAGLIIALLLAAYIGFKLWQRQRFMRSLRTARIAPEDLFELLEAGEPLSIVDLRHSAEIEAAGVQLPGAIWFSRAELAERHLEIPRDRDVILYCS